MSGTLKVNSSSQKVFARSALAPNENGRLRRGSTIDLDEQALHLGIDRDELVYGSATGVFRDDREGTFDRFDSKWLAEKLVSAGTACLCGEHRTRIRAERDDPRFGQCRSDSFDGFEFRLCAHVDEEYVRIATRERFEARLERLKRLRNGCAETVRLDPGLVCPNGTLQGLAREIPKSTDDLDQIAELRRWQREVLGEKNLLAAVQG